MQNSTGDHIESRLRDARDALAKAEGDLAAIDAEETDAVGSAEAYAGWRAKRDSLPGEVERLRKLIGILELEAEERSRAEADADFRRRHAEKIEHNAKLAKRIRQDLAEANSTLLSLLHEVAVAAAQDREINASLPDDLEPLVPADILARGQPALARTEISRERVWLWVKRDQPDYIVDYQDQVQDGDNGRGLLTVGVSTFPVLQRAFEKVTYYSEQAAPRVQSLLTMRLPCADEPGFVYDGTNFPERAALAIARSDPAAAKERPVETELVPIENVIGVASEPSNVETSSRPQDEGARRRPD